jgi:uncharacterized protein (TIGR03435 family)
VLEFLRPVSPNEQALASWNQLVEQFTGKPVNFVWIANEKQESLLPFLKEHPVRGWMVLDPQEKSYKAYGMDGGDGVLIDTHGTIAGFTSFIQAEQIQAVLDGRAIAVEGDPTEAQLDAFFDGTAVRLEARPSRTPLPPQKPDLPPTSDKLHISPSKKEGTIGSTGPDHWMRRGFELKAILSEIFHTTRSRIELPAALDQGTRYDFVLVPLEPQDDENMERLVQEGIEKDLRITIATETRPVDVYVITAMESKRPPIRKSEDESSFGFRTFSTKWRMTELPEGNPRTRKSAEEATRRAMDNPEFRQAMAMAQLMGMTEFSHSMDDFRRTLEDGLKQPVVDETNLTGDFEFKIEGDPQTTDEFLAMLSDQLGLAITPARRSIELIVVRPSE